MIDATEILQKLYESKINFQINLDDSDDTHAGICFVLHALDPDGFSDLEFFTNIKEGFKFLGDTATELYPECKFAK